MTNIKIDVNKILKWILVLLLANCIVYCSNDKRKTTKKYYPDGKLKKEYGVLDDSILDGIFKYYYENGSLKADGSFRNGENNGHWKYYYEDGKILEEIEYIDGKSDDKDVFYYPNGKLKEIDLYDKGICLRATSYNYNGQIRRDEWETLIEPESDSIKSGNTYRAKINLYHLDSAKDADIKAACITAECFKKDTFGFPYKPGGKYQVYPFHKDYLYTCKIDTPGVYYLSGAIRFHELSGKYNWSEFQHRFVVFL